MRLFPFTRPRTCLYFSTDTCCVGHLRHRLRGSAFTGYHEQRLPPGSIRLSPLEQNVASFEPVLSALHANLPPFQRPRSVALCLPDICLRMAILDFSSLPKSKKDQKALVEWRLQEELNLSPKPRRVSFQRFGAIPSRFSLTRSSSKPLRFLAVAIQDDIIEQYEALCVAAGIIPVSINVAGPAVFNLCRPFIESTLHTHARDISFVPDTAIFAYIGDWGFSLIAYQEGQPCFVRVKPQKQLSAVTVSRPQASIEEPASGRRPQSGSNENATFRTPDLLESPHHREPVATLTQELLGSLQFFFETAMSSGRQTHVYPLFLAGSTQPEFMLPRLAESIERAFPRHQDTIVPQVKAFPIFPRNSAARAKTPKGLTHWTGMALATCAAGYLPS